MEGSDRITPEDLGSSLAEAIDALAKAAKEAAGSVAHAGAARDFGEAAERLGNALSVSAKMKGGA